MSKAIRIHKTGGAEVLRWEDVNVGQPGPGEIKLRQTAVGLNFIDIYHRTGLYPLPNLPAVLGLEGAGVITEIGTGVSDFKVGDRVAYASPPAGAYAEERLIPAQRVVKLPDSISDIQAAGMMLQGMTARYLLHGCFQVKAGDTILIHAAAGGVGLIVCQWAKHLGAKVIGTVGSTTKAELALAHGCDHAIRYGQEDLVQRVKELTGGRGVEVVYDSVGKDTFMASLDCLRPRGMLVSFGQASGPVPPFEPSLLNVKGSLFLTRPSLMHYTAEREELLACAADLFSVVQSGVVKIEINQTFPLREAAEAQRALEERRTTGTTVLLP